MRKNAPPQDLATRRRFLQMLAGGSVALAGCSSGPWDKAAEPSAAATAAPTPTMQARAAAGATSATSNLADRILVAIELDGGCDGLDTVVPYANPLYRDLRPNVGLDPTTALALDDSVGLNANLARFHERGVAVVQGVGSADPDLSHFESMRRWRVGDPSGSSNTSTGFFGRMCDQLDVGDPVTGVSLDWGSSPALASDQAVTLALPDAWSGWWLTSEDDWDVAYRNGLAAMSQGDDERLDTSRVGLTKALAFAEVLAEMSEAPDDVYPGGDLSDRLRLAGQLIGTKAGVRVLHVPWGNFDTHSDHRGTHDYLMTELDESVDAFLVDMADRGMADRVLVATYSEFGRRPEENDGGTDHGTASVALLAGAVEPGQFGEYSSLSKLDDDGNLVATVSFDRYYATLAEKWFGLSPSDVLADAPEPIEGLLV